MRELAPVARGSQDEGFTQPRAHHLADPCIYDFLHNLEADGPIFGFSRMLSCVFTLAEKVATNHRGLNGFTCIVGGVGTR